MAERKGVNVQSGKETHGMTNAWWEVLDFFKLMRTRTNDFQEAKSNALKVEQSLLTHRRKLNLSLLMWLPGTLIQSLTYEVIHEEATILGAVWDKDQPAWIFLSKFFLLWLLSTMTFSRQMPNCGGHERGYQRCGGFHGQHAEEKVATKESKQSRDKKDKSVDSAFVYEDVFSKYDYWLRSASELGSQKQHNSPGYFTTLKSMTKSASRAFHLRCFSRTAL